MKKTWPSLTGEQFIDALRRNGWRVLETEQRTIAEKGRGAVWVRLPFRSSDLLEPDLVQRWGENFGLTPDDFL